MEYRVFVKLHFFPMIFQDPIRYRYYSSSSSSSWCCSYWGDALQKKPKAPSFQIGSGWNLAGLFFNFTDMLRRLVNCRIVIIIIYYYLFKRIRIDWRSPTLDVTSYIQDGGRHDVISRPPGQLAAAWCYEAVFAGCPVACRARVASVPDPEYIPTCCAMAAAVLKRRQPYCFACCEYLSVTVCSCNMSACNMLSMVLRRISITAARCVAWRCVAREIETLSASTLSASLYLSPHNATQRNA